MLGTPRFVGVRAGDAGRELKATESSKNSVLQWPRGWKGACRVLTGIGRRPESGGDWSTGKGVWCVWKLEVCPPGPGGQNIIA